jgi:hypothetical protein
VGALVMALNCSCTLRASGNKHSKTALVKVRTLGGLQVKHSVWQKWQTVLLQTQCLDYLTIKSVI